MRNPWLVARYEYRRIVVRRGFLFGTLAIPLGLVLLFALLIVIMEQQGSDLPLGYVDRAGILDLSQLERFPGEVSGVDLVAFEDPSSALDALENQQVQAVFVLPADYLETQESDLYFLEEPPDNEVWREFDDYVRVNLVAAMPAEKANRLLAGPDVTVIDLDSGRQFSENALINIILPFIASFFFIFAVMTAASYMIHVVADEKENRTMEVMLTSLSARQLIGGKAAGLLAVTLTQLLIWVAVLVIGLAVATPYVDALQRIQIPWVYLGVIALFFFPAYAFLAALMVAVGAAVTEVQEGQQLSGLFSLVMMAPLFLLVLLFSDPGHPIYVFFTLFPPTAFLAISLRWGLGTIPLWQLGLSFFLLLAGVVVMTAIAARLFRAGMLRYGQPLSLKGALAALRAG